jgi:hypothetical protein
MTSAPPSWSTWATRRAACASWTRRASSRRGRSPAGGTQDTGAGGGTANAQVGVFLAYASARGAALVDRARYLPRAWTHDPARRAAAGVPDGLLVWLVRARRAVAPRPARPPAGAARRLRTGALAGGVAGGGATTTVNALISLAGPVAEPLLSPSGTVIALVSRFPAELLYLLTLIVVVTVSDLPRSFKAYRLGWSAGRTAN